MAAPAPILDARDLRRTHADRVVLESVSLTIGERERVGLVGNNGQGKSTLARILAGVEASDGGEIARRRGASIEYLEQAPDLPAGETIRDVVLASLADWTDARQRYDDLTEALSRPDEDTVQLAEAQAAVGDELERLGGWDRMHDAEAIIGHLGIADSSRRVDELSGGEARRVALARILVGTPDLAILDEPTNHLDVTTIEWLEDHLVERFPGAILLITHDRYVLDRVTTRTLEVHRGNLSAFEGGYTAYLQAKADRQAHEDRVESNRQNFLRAELEWMRRQPKARGTKQKARADRAQEALDRGRPARDKTVALGASSERQGKTVFEANGLRVVRDGRTLIDGLDLAIRPGERLGIVGPNGIGKTSLLLVLLQQLEVAAGEWVVGKNTKMAYLDQARSGLDDDWSVFQALEEQQTRVTVGDHAYSVAQYLERFLFDRNTQRMKVGLLSGGERARVCLARLLAQPSNLLLLDEPTNDLDVSTLGALESMLLEYPGSALIVSHDRWFLDRVATSILAFEAEGKVERHAGAYTEYRLRRDVERREAAATREPAARPARKAEPKPAQEGPKKLSFAERRELDGIFARIELAETRVGELETRLADPALYKDDGGAAVPEVQRELAEAQTELESLTQRWEELEARRGG